MPEHLSDRSLRSALEFAVGLAAAGQRTQPPLVFPAGLKPFLKLQSLPTVALAKVRVAVEDDEAYRLVLAGVATRDLIDEVGMLWLQRPVGWQEDAVALVEAADRARGEARESAEVRREQKRRDRRGSRRALIVMLSIFGLVIGTGVAYVGYLAFTVGNNIDQGIVLGERQPVTAPDGEPVGDGEFILVSPEGSITDFSSDEGAPLFGWQLREILSDPVSYTHLRAPRDRTRSRMPSSA